MVKTACFPTIDEKVAFLSRAVTYPDHGGKIDVVETHLSWVFLAGTRVYKIKKPVVRELVNLGSIEARYRNSVAEVRLNRQLGGVYLGVERLPLLPGGRLTLGQGGWRWTGWWRCSGCRRR